MSRCALQKKKTGLDLKLQLLLKVKNMKYLYKNKSVQAQIAKGECKKSTNKHHEIAHEK